MSDNEEEVVAGEEEEEEVAAAPGPSEPMDMNTAVQDVLKKALAHGGLARGIREATRVLEQGAMAVVAEDCDQPDIRKLVEALCNEYGVQLLSVPESKQLGQWAGLCKIDAEGEARKVVGCSVVVVTDFGEKTEGLATLKEQLGEAD